MLSASWLGSGGAHEHANAVADALEAHGIPFIIATGYDDPKLFGFEGRPVVRKPFLPEQLEQALQSLEPRRQE
jgi:hypothetical protein